MHLIPLIEFAKPKSGEIFYDLGCGAGRPVITTALAFPQLKVCKGIEFLQGLTSLAQDVATKTIAGCKEQGIDCAPIEI